MTFHIVTSPANPSDPDADFVVRSQRLHAAKQDDSDQFKTVGVEIETGAKDAKSGKRSRAILNLKFALDGTYIFAVYGENPAFHTLDREEWDAAAKNAIEKFVGTRGLAIKFGPRPESHNRYNIMAELDKPIEQKPETLVVFAEQTRQRQERAEAEALMKKLGLSPPQATNTGPYRPI